MSKQGVACDQNNDAVVGGMPNSWKGNRSHQADVEFFLFSVQQLDPIVLGQIFSYANIEAA